MLNKCYSELIQIPTFEGRIEYLRTHSPVGGETFGVYRYLNQAIYRNNPEWKHIKAYVINRDNACDLAFPGNPIGDLPAVIHHINPITIDMVERRDPLILDPENLVTTILFTHNIIHYGTDLSVQTVSIIERKPNDTIPWRK